VVDVDGDGDMDVLSASFYDLKIAWYENDGNENFTPHTITTSASGASSVFAVDIDGDGDMDVLSASYMDNKIAWYENDGNENFTPHIITTSAMGAVSVFAVDVDSDGDMDVISASDGDGKIAWYENMMINSVDDHIDYFADNYKLYDNYPNPFNHSTLIEFSLPKPEFVELKVYNILGKEVATLVSKKLNQGNHIYTFDGKNLASGIYYYMIKAGEFQQSKKMLLIK
jgi:hypothetical protein